VTPDNAGVGSGLVNTAIMKGGALGLAVLASLAATFTQAQAVPSSLGALNSGYHLALVIAAAVALAAAAMAAMRLGASRAARIPTSSSA
jgi:hypothetical protein